MRMTVISSMLRPGSSRLSIGLVLLLMMAGATVALPTYNKYLPNGRLVPCPTDPSTGKNVSGCDGAGFCQGLGHNTCAGGSLPFNKFGADFSSQLGQEWKAGLCQLDSDGDGLTNGEELGDPCCTWSVTTPARLPDGMTLRTYAVSHPGIKSSVSKNPVRRSTFCASGAAAPTVVKADRPAEQHAAEAAMPVAAAPALARDAAAATPATAAAAAPITAAPIAAQALVESDQEYFMPGEVQMSFNLSIDVTIAPEETSYFFVPLEIPLLANLAYHVVGYEVLRDKVENVHHFILMGCTDPVPKVVETLSNLTAYGLTSTDGNRTFGPKAFNVPPNCQEVLFGWAPGPLTRTFAPDTGIRLGVNGSWSSLLLQMHYTNPSKVAGMVDRSAIRVFATPTLRKHDIGVLFTGPAEKLAPIPPGRPSHFHNSVCSFYSAAYPKRTNWTVFGYNFHAHLLGRAFATEIWAKPDWQTNTTAKVADVGRDHFWNFENQYAAETDQPLVLRFGDLLSTTCLYNSTGKTTSTPGGHATYEEMCISFIYYYPRTSFDRCLPVFNKSASLPMGDMIPSTPDLYGADWGKNIGGANATLGTRYTQIQRALTRQRVAAGPAGATALAPVAAAGPAGALQPQLAAPAPEAAAAAPHGGAPPPQTAQVPAQTVMTPPTGSATSPPAVSSVVTSMGGPE